jgi:hypothetical protein
MRLFIRRETTEFIEYELAVSNGVVHAFGALVVLLMVTGNMVFVQADRHSFTGYDLVLFAVIAIALLLIGAAVTKAYVIWLALGRKRRSFGGEVSFVFHRDAVAAHWVAGPAKLLMPGTRLRWNKPQSANAPGL